ncbi:MAG: CARDB domain-containing protein [Methanomassiliicoccales archaeon]
MVILAAIVLLTALPIVHAETYDPLYAEIDGPQVVTTSSVTMYTLVMFGGPAEVGVGNYSYKATMTGSGNTYGAFFVPGTVEPTADGTFSINLTAPAVAQTMTISIECQSASASQTVKTTISFQVKVVDPIVLYTTVENTGDVDAVGVPISLQLYQDGEWVEFHRTTIDLAAGESYQFQYNWTAMDLSSGEHKVRMVLDPNNEIITFEGGASVYETTIYYKMPGYDWVNTLMWVLVAALGVTIFFVWRRPARGKKKR